ncbi:MAG: hypothetical protein DKT66_24690 [Candidatus Melainabacteria bacterium]|nr:MAG: hypothetical protein DKT66_24690 [Candidatus Melainabacteria bacterium]
MKSYGPYMAPLESSLTPIPQFWQTTVIAKNASKYQLLQRKSMQNNFDKFWKKWGVLFLRTMRSGVRISPGRYIERLSLSEFAKVKPFFIGAGEHGGTSSAC